MITKTITCILCPNGCELEVSYQGEPSEKTVYVEGNQCSKGKPYALEELLHPKRTLTTSVLVLGGEQPLISVKTATPIPRKFVFKARSELKGIVAKAPVAIGDVIMADIAGTGVDVVVTRAATRKP